VANDSIADTVSSLNMALQQMADYNETIVSAESAGTVPLQSGTKEENY